MDQLYKKYPSFGSRLYVFLRTRILHLEAIDAALPKSGTIYDIGCGYGITSYYLSQKSPQRNITGIDVDAHRINILQKVFADKPNLKFKVVDLRNDTTLEKSDGILMYDLIHHIPFKAQLELFASAKNNLKSGGVLVIKEIDAAKPFKTFFTWVLDMIVTKFQPVYYRKATDLKSTLEEMGFQVSYSEIKSLLPYPHYMLVCTL